MYARSIASRFAHPAWILVVAVVLAPLSAPDPAAAGADPTLKCWSAKLKTAGKRAQCRGKTDATAVKKQTSPDYAKCDEKFVGGFAKAEDKGGDLCPTSDDATDVSSTMDACLDGVVATLGGVPGPGTGVGCESSKLKSMSKYSLCTYKAEGKAVSKGLLPYVDKCVSKLADGFAKTESKYPGDCVTTSDATAVQDAVDACNEEGFALIAGRPVFPETAEEYVTGQVSFIDTMSIPPLDGNDNPTCCKDFGAISKDFLVDGTNLPDNALARIGGLLDTLTGGTIDLSALLQSAIATEDQIILLDHQSLSDTSLPDLFTLVQLDGIYDNGTHFSDAQFGNGEFLIARSSFLYDDVELVLTGEPRSYSFPAQMQTSSMNSGDPFPLQMKLPFGVLTVDALAQQARVTADHGPITPAGIEYTNGQITGYVPIDDLFNNFNATLNSPTCACLGLTEDVYQQDPIDGTWSSSCIPNANDLCTDVVNNGVCVTLADPDLNPGFGTLSGVCGVMVVLLQGVGADIDLDGNPAPPVGTGRYEALSLGIEFAAEPAQVNGIEP